MSRRDGHRGHDKVRCANGECSYEWIDLECDEFVELDDKFYHEACSPSGEDEVAE